MRRPHRHAVGLLLLLLVMPAHGADEPAVKVFRLGKYVKGTAAEIRQTLQGPVDEFTEKTKAAEQRVAECEAGAATARQAALPRLRASSPKYRELAETARRAEEELERARRSGTVQQRLDAGSRLNHARAGMEQMEKSAVAGDRDVGLEQARLEEERQSVTRCRESLEKATVWRDQWVYAIECTFRMNAPLAVGSEGVLTTVRVLKPPRPDHEGLLVLYEAAEQVGRGGEVEGIQTVNVVMKKERLLLGPDAPGAEGAKRGDVLKLFRNYRVQSVATDREGPVYVTAREPADVDALMAEIMPLRKDEKTPG
jgi:hypothetical protein